MNRNEKISSILEKVFAFLAFLPIPIALILWVFTQFPGRTIFGVSLVYKGFGFADLGMSGSLRFLGFSNPSIPIMGDLTSSLRFGGFLVSLPLVGLQTYWLWQLKGLFGCYAKGNIFTLNTTAYIHRAAMAILGSAVVAVFVESAVMLLLTANNPVGHRMLSISLSGSHISDILTGLVLVVIAWIMNEGRKLKEDVDYTV